MQLRADGTTCMMPQTKQFRVRLDDFNFQIIFLKFHKKWQISVYLRPEKGRENTSDQVSFRAKNSPYSSKCLHY